MTAVATMRLGTRGSRLAMAQARLAATALGATAGTIELVPVATSGDELSRRRPRGTWVSGDGQFTRELERALLEGQVDLAVHSYKDLPTEPVDGLVVAAVLERGDPRDCLVTADGSDVHDLRFGARVGTSSTRRAAQLAVARPDFITVPMRGNVESRLRRLTSGELDAVVLAAAGLDRLGIEVADRARLPYEVMLPAPAQGALAIQARADDLALRAALAAVDHADTRTAVEAERALLRRIGGGCLAPLGALAEADGGTLHLRAAFEDAAGCFWRAEATGPRAGADAIVDDVAEQIRDAAMPT